MKYHCNSCGYTYNPYVALMEFNTRNAAKPKYMIDHPTTQVEVEDEELSGETLIEIADSARDSAFAPYSEYPVGAALNTDNGIFTGCNIECSGLSTSVHAEMLAFFKAVEDGATEFYRLAVSVEGDVNEWPCGLCQHTIAQFTEDIEIFEQTPDGVESRMLSELIGDAYRPRGNVIDSKQ